MDKDNVFLGEWVQYQPVSRWILLQNKPLSDEKERIQQYYWQNGEGWQNLSNQIDMQLTIDL